MCLSHVFNVAYFLHRCNHCPKKWTPLHVAAHNGHVDIFKLLCLNGADNSIKNNVCNFPFQPQTLFNHCLIPYLQVIRFASILTIFFNSTGGENSHAAVPWPIQISIYIRNCWDEIPILWESATNRRATTARDPTNQNWENTVASTSWETSWWNQATLSQVKSRIKLEPNSRNVENSC